MNQLHGRLGNAGAKAARTRKNLHPGAVALEVGIVPDMRKQLVAGNLLQQLVALVANQRGEARGEPRFQGVLAQQAGAIGVDGANGRGREAGKHLARAVGQVPPIFAHNLEQAMGHAQAQFGGGVVREGHQQDAARINALLEDKPFVELGDLVGFAGSGGGVVDHVHCGFSWGAGLKRRRKKPGLELGSAVCLASRRFFPGRASPPPETLPTALMVAS